MSKLIDFQYEVALSYASEDRKYVEEVAKNLDKLQISLFYDNFEKVSLWGKNLYDHLDDVYRKKSMCTVVFISSFYKEKVWTNHERRSYQARAVKENIEFILPVRFDDTEIPGILDTVGYLEATDISPERLSEMIALKVEAIRKNLN